MFASLARTFAVVLAVFAALLVAAAVGALRALDARGVALAGVILDALRRSYARPAPARPAPARAGRTAPPVNRRRSRAVILARHGVEAAEAGETAEHNETRPGWRECPACDGTGEGWSGRRCCSCHGNGEVRAPSALDFDGFSLAALA